MELAVSQSQGLRGILMEMREGIVALGDIEAKDAEADWSSDGFLEGTFVLMSSSVDTLPCEQVVLVLIELFLDLSSEHI